MKYVHKNVRWAYLWNTRVLGQTCIVMRSYLWEFECNIYEKHYTFSEIHVRVRNTRWVEESSWISGCSIITRPYQARGLRNIGTCLFPTPKIKWLISTGGMVSSSHTQAGMDACGTIGARLLMQSEGWLTGWEMAENRNGQSGPNLSNGYVLCRQVYMIIC